MSIVTLTFIVTAVRDWHGALAGSAHVSRAVADLLLLLGLTDGAALAVIGRSFLCLRRSRVAGVVVFEGALCAFCALIWFRRGRQRCSHTKGVADGQVPCRDRRSKPEVRQRKMS
jgi:hypothetical protein